MGFEADIQAKDDTDINEVMAMVQPEDLIKFGLIPEFIGRIPITATLGELSLGCPCKDTDRTQECPC